MRHILPLLALTLVFPAYAQPTNQPPTTALIRQTIIQPDAPWP
jgi:hypothetical protein